VLAAFGGFEIAMMVGVMLVAGSKRHLIMIDGMPACAALMVAARIAPAVTDYCVFCRSHSHPGLDQALACSMPRRCSSSAWKAPTAPAPRWPGRWCAAPRRC
jgi:NaMN:DMB phosphoribosyltransferase